MWRAECAELDNDIYNIVIPFESNFMVSKGTKQ